MARLGRNLLLLTVPAGACGALLAVLAASLGGPPGTPPNLPADEDRPDVPEPEIRPENGPSRRPPRPRARAGGRTTRIDPKIVAALEDPEESVRLDAALTLLRLGPSRLSDMYVLEPRRPEARALLSRVEEALGVLDRIERGVDYADLPEENRLEVRLKYWSRAVPPEKLRDERLAYWTLRVAGDPERLRLRAIEPGEARWHELELARVRRELGRIDDAEWRRLLDERLPEVRAWVASLRTRSDVPPSRAAEIEGAVASFGP